MSDEITPDDSIDPVISQFRKFFANHPELPQLPEVWTVLVDFLFDKQLTTSASNIEFAYKVNRVEIDKLLTSIPASEWKTRVVIPEWKQRQASQPKRESRVPLGVKYTEWLHNQ